MTELEFNEVLNAMEINNPIATTHGRYGKKTDVHAWHNIGFNFGGSYYTVVSGKIPFEVAENIYNKYPDNPYIIRIAGGCEDWKPSEWAVTGPNGEKYITGYHIDTKEGLLILLCELEDYYLRKENKKANTMAKYDELLDCVNEGLLSKIDPTISGYDWMQGDKKNKDFYNAQLENYGSQFIQKLREAVDSFDKAVNPFLDDSIELASSIEYQDKVTISGSLYNGDERRDCCVLTIKDNTPAGNYTRYQREDDGFVFELNCMIGKKCGLKVWHYYGMKSQDENFNGDIICFETFGDNKDNKIDIRYNITKGTIGTTYGEKHPVTQIELRYVYEKLLDAIELAKKLTVKNMKKKSNIK